MKRFFVIISVSIVALAAIYFFVFPRVKEGQVSIVCTDVEQFESSLGIINIGQKNLGDVLLVDTNKKRVFRIGNLKNPASEITSSSPLDSIILLSNTKFKIQLSGDITKAPGKLRAEIGSQIDNNTTFFLSNCSLSNLENISRDLTSANESDPEKYSDPLKRNPNTVIAVVHAMAYADRFEFRLKKKSDATVKINTMTVGDYKLNLSYACENSLNINAKHGGIFYKVTFYTFYLNSFVLLSTDINLNEYKMAESSLE